MAESVWHGDEVFWYILVGLGCWLWGGFVLTKAIVHGSALRLVTAIGIVVTLTSVFALVGSGVGFTIGKFTPDYYRSLYRAGHSPEFDPVAMGLGLGLTQGAASGALLGMALVGGLVWYRGHSVSNQQGTEAQPA